jgi:hypothetical protein
MNLKEFSSISKLYFIVVNGTKLNGLLRFPEYEPVSAMKLPNSIKLI